MEPHAFVKEVYRRMSLRHATGRPRPSWTEMKGQRQVLQAMHEMQSLLPQDKDSAILDIGFGTGWFVAACLSLGYTNLSRRRFRQCEQGLCPRVASGVDRTLRDRGQHRQLSFRPGATLRFHSHVARDRAHSKIFLAVGGERSLPGAEARWNVDAAHAEYGGSMRKLVLLRDPGARIWLQ